MKFIVDVDAKLVLVPEFIPRSCLTQKPGNTVGISLIIDIHDENQDRNSKGEIGAETVAMIVKTHGNFFFLKTSKYRQSKPSTP